MELATSRLVLRRPCPDDLEALFAIHSDPRTNAHNPAGPDRTIADTQRRLTEWLAHWDEHGFGYWSVVHEHSVVGIGGLIVKPLDGEDALNLYYRFAVFAWGSGFATELARAALAFARDQLGGRRVVAIINPENLPSLRVAERVGMRHAGTIMHAHGERLLLVAPA